MESPSEIVYRRKDKAFAAHASSFSPEPDNNSLLTRGLSPVPLRHTCETPNKALRRREARKSIKSTPITPDNYGEIIDSSDYRESGLKKLKSNSYESIARWEKENEFLFALIEDESDWLTRLFPESPVDHCLFFPALEDGYLLCKLARLCQTFADTYHELHPTDGTAGPFAISIHPREKCRGRIGQFKSRENVELFLKWCRHHQLSDAILFESNDVVERTEGEGLRDGAREIVLCLMEVARMGVRWGVEPPKLVLLEREIEMEEQMELKLDGNISPISVDSGVDTTDHIMDMNDDMIGRSQHNNPTDPTKTPTSSVRRKKGVVTRQKSVENEKNLPKTKLHTMVTDLIEAYNIEKITRLKEGKYIILGKVMFVRLLNDHCIVRIGGGWDTLEHYIMTHVHLKESALDELSETRSNKPRRRKSSHFRRRKNSFLTKSTPNLLNLTNEEEPLPSSKDPYLDEQLQRKHDDRKISQAIVRVTTNISSLKKAASLDWTHLKQDGVRKLSAFSPLTQERFNQLSKMSDLTTSADAVNLAHKDGPSVSPEKVKKTATGKTKPGKYSNIKSRIDSKPADKPTKVNGKTGPPKKTSDTTLAEKKNSAAVKKTATTKSSKTTTLASTSDTATKTKKTTRPTTAPSRSTTTERKVTKTTDSKSTSKPLSSTNTTAKNKTTTSTTKTTSSNTKPISAKTTSAKPSATAKPPATKATTKPPNPSSDTKTSATKETKEAKTNKTRRPATAPASRTSASRPTSKPTTKPIASKTAKTTSESTASKKTTTSKTATSVKKTKPTAKVPPTKKVEPKSEDSTPIIIPTAELIAKSDELLKTADEPLNTDVLVMDETPKENNENSPDTNESDSFTQSEDLTSDTQVDAHEAESKTKLLIENLSDNIESNDNIKKLNQEVNNKTNENSQISAHEIDSTSAESQEVVCDVSAEENETKSIESTEEVVSEDPMQENEAKSIESTEKVGSENPLQENEVKSQESTEEVVSESPMQSIESTEEVVLETPSQKNESKSKGETTEEVVLETQTQENETKLIELTDEVVSETQSQENESKSIDETTEEVVLETQTQENETKLIELTDEVVSETPSQQNEAKSINETTDEVVLETATQENETKSIESTEEVASETPSQDNETKSMETTEEVVSKTALQENEAKSIESTEEVVSETPSQEYEAKSIDETTDEVVLETATQENETKSIESTVEVASETPSQDNETKSMETTEEVVSKTALQENEAKSIESTEEVVSETPSQEYEAKSIDETTDEVVLETPIQENVAKSVDESTEEVVAETPSQENKAKNISESLELSRLVSSNTLSSEMIPQDDPTVEAASESTVLVDQATNETDADSRNELAEKADVDVSHISCTPASQPTEEILDTPSITHSNAIEEQAMELRDSGNESTENELTVPTDLPSDFQQYNAAGDQTPETPLSDVAVFGSSVDVSPASNPDSYFTLSKNEEVFNASDGTTLLKSEQPIEDITYAEPDSRNEDEDETTFDQQDEFLRKDEIQGQCEVTTFENEDDVNCEEEDISSEVEIIKVSVHQECSELDDTLVEASSDVSCADARESTDVNDPCIDANYSDEIKATKAENYSDEIEAKDESDSSKEDVVNESTSQGNDSLDVENICDNRVDSEEGDGKDDKKEDVTSEVTSSEVDYLSQTASSLQEPTTEYLESNEQPTTGYDTDDLMGGEDEQQTYQRTSYDDELQDERSYANTEQENTYEEFATNNTEKENTSQEFASNNTELENTYEEFASNNTRVEENSYYSQVPNDMNQQTSSFESFSYTATSCSHTEEQHFDQSSTFESSDQLYTSNQGEQIREEYNLKEVNYEQGQSYQGDYMADDSSSGDEQSPNHHINYKPTFQQDCQQESNDCHEMDQLAEYSADHQTTQADLLGSY